MKRTTALFFILGLCTLFSCSNKERESYVWSHVWQDADGVYKHYRIPAIIVTQNETVLIFCEGRSGRDASDIDLLVRRSEDNGRSWSEQAIVWEDENNTCGNPCPVIDEETGRIILFMSWNLFEEGGRTVVTKSGKDTRRPFMCYSDDDGLTWSEPLDMTASCKDPDWGWYATGPGVGIQLRSEKYKNRLVIPANHSYTVKAPDEPVIVEGYGYGAHALLSDDGGATWRMSLPITPGCNESQVVELVDGALMMNMRSYQPRGLRSIATSIDGGETWTEARQHDQLPEPTCQGSFLRYTTVEDGGGNRLLFSNPPNPLDRRDHLTVKLSYDEGRTWPVSRLICEGPSGYSCLTILPDKSIGLLYDKDKSKTLTFARFTLDWLTDGKDSL